MRGLLKCLLLGFLFLFIATSVRAQNDSVIIDSQKLVKQPNKLFKKAVVPITFVAYGTLSLGSGSLRQFDRYVNRSTIGEHGYSGSVDDYLRYGPIGAVYGLNLIDIRSKNNFIDRSAILLISASLTSTLVTITKKGVGRERPDGSGFTSFPSAHTAMAFMSAEFMYREFRDRSLWYSVAGYAMATTTGVLRLYHHVHWVSDVIMGAGYGILSTKLAYIVYPYLKRIFIPEKKMNVLILPSFQKGYTGLSLNYALQ